MKINSMKKDLTNKIRCILDFMEKSDALIDEARRTGDTEWEENLLAGLSNAQHDLRRFTDELLCGGQGRDATAANEGPHF